MSAKGSIFRGGKRDYIFSPTFHKENIVKERNIDISYKDCKNIIDTANKNIADIVVDDIEGFKLPFGLGYICVVKFKIEKEVVNHHLSKKLKKRVLHLNLNTMGYMCKVGWHRVSYVTGRRLNEAYKFKAARYLSRPVSFAFLNGKRYAELNTRDFMQIGKLENFFNRKFRPEFKS